MFKNLTSSSGASGYPEFTIATLPDAAAAAWVGRKILCTDLWVAGGTELRSKGGRWVPAGTTPVYKNSGDVIVTNTTADTEVATFTIPAKLMGAGMLTIFADWGQTNSANAKQFKAVFGGTLLVSPSGFTSAVTGAGMYHIRNVTPSVQVGTGAIATGLGTSTGALATGAINTDAADVVVSIQFKMAALGETITLKNLYVELKP